MGVTHLHNTKRGRSHRIWEVTTRGRHTAEKWAETSAVRNRFGTNLHINLHIYYNNPLDVIGVYLRSHNADAALSLWVTQALHSTCSLIEWSQTGSKVCGIPTVCRRKGLIIQYKKVWFGQVHNIVETPSCECGDNKIAIIPKFGGSLRYV